MDKKYKIICLCGSTRFKDDFMREQQRLTLAGNIVLSEGVFAHYDNIPLTFGEKAMLDDIHLHKIDISDEIFVINKNGYIGESTKKEINYATITNKPVRYMEENRERNRRSLFKVV